MGAITKVMKYELHYLDGCKDFSTMQQQLWDFQRQTREILNKTVQIAYHWDYQNFEHYKQTNTYMDLQEETGYKSMDGYVYNALKDQYSDIYRSNLNATVRKAWKKYKAVRKDIMQGTVSLPSYRRDQPLVLHNESVHLAEDTNGCVARLKLLSGSFSKRTGSKRMMGRSDRSCSISLRRPIRPENVSLYTIGPSGFFC